MFQDPIWGLWQVTLMRRLPSYSIPIGVLIYDVMEGSAAHGAGLKRGDVIIEMNGEKILTMEQLTGIISDSKVGDIIHVVAIRGDERLEMDIKLQEKK